MRSITRAPSRVLITVAATGAALSIGVLSAAPAGAHVHVDAENATPGSTSVLTFRVPGESETGALTTELSVALPNVASARTQVMADWTARLDRDTEAGTVSAVTWTAAPGTGISSDQFALFRVSVKLPSEDSVSLPTTQIYSDGTVVRWDQAPLPDGAEPEHPAPLLTLSGGGAPSPEDHPSAAPQAPEPPQAPATQETPATVDNPARWLAGGALIAAALAVVASLLARRRS